MGRRVSNRAEITNNPCIQSPVRSDLLNKLVALSQKSHPHLWHRHRDQALLASANKQPDKLVSRQWLFVQY